MLAITSLSAVVLAVLPQLAWATIDNHCEAQRLSESAHQFDHGYYNIKNAATGKSISYKNSNGHWFYPTEGDAASLELASSQNSTFAWTSVHVENTNKCASAQWNYTYCEGNGCDWAAVLYRCAIDEHAYEGSTVNTNKQYWLFVPSETNDKAYYIIAVDHLKDMATRGWKSCTQTTTEAGVQSTCLEELDFEDPAFQWYVTATGEEAPDTVSDAYTSSASSTSTSAPSSTTSASATTSTSSGTVTVTVTKTVNSCATNSSKSKRSLNRRAAEALQSEPEWPAVRRRRQRKRQLEAAAGMQALEPLSAAEGGMALPTPAPTVLPSKFRQPGRRL